MRLEHMRRIELGKGGLEVIRFPLNKDTGTGVFRGPGGLHAADVGQKDVIGFQGEE